jgi:ABC-type bacteriocin/lantibiotic exporter with double-glycine peptidase domain
LPPATRVKRLEVKELTFHFPDKQGFSLRIPSLVARRGEIVGIAGPNGSGKTTLARLMAGIYQPQAGRVAFVKESGGECAPSDRRAMFGFLPQEPALFDGTLRENVTLFDAQPDLARLNAIESELDLKHWLASLPRGWETEINAGLSMTFSGGQLQRIGLARLLYHPRAALIFDEPANGLDESAQVLLEGMLHRSRGEQIIIIITHSPGTLALCDRIYRLHALPGSHDYECLEEPALALRRETDVVMAGEKI